MGYFYQYGLYHYNDIDGSEDYSQGVLRASSFVDAVSQLVEYYGEGNINSIDYLTWTDSYGVLCLEDLDEFKWKPQKRKVCGEDNF